MSGRDRPLPSQIPGSTSVDVAIYTAVVLVTDCNISLLPARPYFCAEYQQWQPMTGSGDNVTISCKYYCRS